MRRKQPIALQTQTQTSLSWSGPAASAASLRPSSRPQYASDESTSVDTRAQLFRKFKGLEIDDCPFVNLPEERSGRWGPGLTKAKMAECRWLKPVLVGQFEFLEWTADNHVGIRVVGVRDEGGG